MATVTARLGGQTRTAQITVQRPTGSGPVGFLMPAVPNTVRTITGQAVSSLQSGTRYVNCSFGGGLWFDGHTDIDIDGYTGGGTLGFTGATKRIRVKGGPGEFGHKRDSGQPGAHSKVVSNGQDLCPSDITLDGLRITDSQRTTTGVHIEGFQIGGVQRIRFNACQFDRNSIFDIFMRSWIGVGGTDFAPIEDVLIEGCSLAATTNTVDSGSGSAAVSLMDLTDAGARMGQLKRAWVRNNRCGQAITVQPPALETDGLVVIEGNTDMAGTRALVRSVSGSPQVLRYA